MLMRLALKPAQRGVSLIESLIALLLFAIGILALLGMYARSVGTAGDAQYRIEASAYAEELLQNVAAAVARGSGLVDTTKLREFELNTGAGATTCPFTAANDSKVHPTVDAWLNRIKADRTGLPGAATAGYQQVLVETGGAVFNRVTITLCWSVPGDAQPRRHQVIGYVN